jgi:NAD(P)-dependent dehydrogenase (short-subunit alcohol dehydrogenase family)
MPFTRAVAGEHHGRQILARFRVYPDIHPPKSLVTGSNRGLGLEFLTQLAEDPKTLAIALCRSDSEGLTKLVKAKSNVKIVTCDTGDDSSVKRAAKQVEGLNGGKLDVLINNAAVNPGTQKVSEM